MDFSLSDAQKKLRRSVVKFAKNELNDSVLHDDKISHFNKENWQKCCDFGLLGLAAPKAFGGRFDSIDIQTCLVAMEAFGYGCRDNGLAFGLNAQMWVVQMPIAHFGTDDQKTRFLKPLVSGKWLGAQGLTEPEAGSDVYSLQTSAKKVQGGYILNGQKHLITLGSVADLALVFARTDPEKGQWGLSAFLVEAGTKGFTQHQTNEKMGLRTVPIGALEFKDCFIPEENRLGREGDGYSIINYSLEYDRCCILASQVGRMERQLEETIDFVKSRQQFGQSVSCFQSVSNRVADMKLRLEISKLLLAKIGWLKSQGKSAPLEAAMLKLHISEAFLASSMDAIRNRGGSGFLSENEVERDLRDSVGGVLYAGTSDIQRQIIASMLGL